MQTRTAKGAHQTQVLTGEEMITSVNVLYASNSDGIVKTYVRSPTIKAKKFAEIAVQRIRPMS